MALSMLLLLLFQGYWLRQLYKEERRNLRREADVLLRETVLGIQLNNMYATGQVTVVNQGRGDRHSVDTGAQAAAALRGIKIDGQGSLRSNVSITLSLTDSGAAPAGSIGSMGGQWRQRRNNGFEQDEPKRLIVRFAMPGQTLSKDTVDSAYGAALRKAGITLPYRFSSVTDSLGSRSPLPLPGTVLRINGSSTQAGFHFFEAELLQSEWFVVKKLAIHILFAVFMTALISTAFWLLFKNIKAQQRMALLKNDFMSNISHELKTPIATVGVALEALKSFDALQSPERTQEYLNIGQNELQRLGLLVDKVLKMSLFEQKQMAMQYEEVDLKLLTEAVIASMRLLLEKANARVRFDAEGGDFVLKGDATHLRSVLYNLLDNALKYSPDNPEIGVRLTATAHSLEWTVTDSGIGIPAVYHSKVFEKFFRVPQGNTHRVKGYGLGLSYVAAVVKQHGGVIAVATNPGGGSIFTVQFNRTELTIT